MPLSSESWGHGMSQLIMMWCSAGAWHPEIKVADWESDAPVRCVGRREGEPCVSRRVLDGREAVAQRDRGRVHRVRDARTAHALPRFLDCFKACRLRASASATI
eukprot:3022371-Rhodomonas_salina.8